MEQQDHRVFAAHSSLGWFAGESGRFEITKPFLECKNAVPTTEPQTLKGTQAAEKFAVVLPRKAPSVIKTKPPPAQKLAKAEAPAPPKTLEKSSQPWRVSVNMAAFLLVALLAMTCAAFGMVDATSLASARGAQSVLHANITGDLDMASSCNPAGIYFDPLSDMADAQSSVLPSSIELLHCEAVMHCNTAGLMPAVHAKMLPPSALGLSGFRHSDWHQNATEGMPCCPKSLPCMHYLKLLPVPTTSSNLQLGLHGSSMSSSLATVEEAKLLAGSADFGSRLNESASLAEQVATTIAAPSPSHLCISAPVHHCTSTRHLSPPSCTLHIIPALPQLHAAAETYPKRVAVLKGRDEQHHWTRLAAAAPELRLTAPACKQLGIALLCRRCWMAAAMGTFLPGPSVISTALGAAILQPLSE